ncbi:MAG: GAF domain-containing sensor histidine kinase [Myxococcaceae bacterium]|nr:GAF domain-containing sensor histidine kinase [Myxococcaceae bacterium]
MTQRVGITAARLAISRLGSGKSSPNALLQRACEISARALNVDRVGVWLFDREQQTLRCRVQHGDKPGETLVAAAAPKYFAEIRQARFLVTHDATHDERTRELAEYLTGHGITAMLDAPVYREGKVVGIVCHERIGGGRDFADAERHFAATVADLVAYFLELEERLTAQRAAYELELELSEARRMETLSEFATGVAHDVGNLLTVISTGLQLSKPPPDIAAMLQDAVARGSDLLQALVKFTRKGHGAPELLTGESLQLRLDRACGAIAHPWRVTFDVADGVEVYAEPIQFEQVVANLVGNARDAMPNGGPVVVRVLRGDGGAKLEVIDCGRGIAEADLRRLFTPFFTTKAPGAGTGLGLSTVQFIAQRHGGRVDVSSALNDGTTVRVFWPQPGA